MGPTDGGLDVDVPGDQALRVRFGLQPGEDPGPRPITLPTPEQAIDPVPRAEPFRQVTPRHPGAGSPPYVVNQPPPGPDPRPGPASFPPAATAPAEPTVRPSRSPRLTPRSSQTLIRSFLRREHRVSVLARERRTRRQVPQGLPDGVRGSELHVARTRIRRSDSDLCDLHQQVADAGGQFPHRVPSTLSCFRLGTAVGSRRVTPAEYIRANHDPGTRRGGQAHADLSETSPAVGLPPQSKVPIHSPSLPYRHGTDHHIQNRPGWGAGSWRGEAVARVIWWAAALR
ncbi:hypothetical protein STSO111631_12635 [Stackebrandtia soli]